MTRIASISRSQSAHVRPDSTLVGWLLMLIVLIAAALFVEDDRGTDVPSLGAHSVSAVPFASEPCQGDDLRSRMCKVATEGGLTAGIQH